MIKKFFILSFVCFVISFSVSTCFALTPEEAKKIYKEMDCAPITCPDWSEEIACFKCSVMEEVSKYYISDWNDSEPDPVPDPAPEPDPAPVPPLCVPEWCAIPVQDCNLPPLEGGTDSCGEPCSKPSVDWPNCIKEDGTIGPADWI